MRKVSKLLSMLLAVGSAAYLISCDPGTITPDLSDPTYTITDANGDVVTAIEGSPGDEVTLTISGEAEAVLNRFVISIIVGTDSVGILDEPFGAAEDTLFNFNVTYTFEEALLNEPAVMEFLAVDGENGQALRSIDVNTTEPPAPIDSYTAVLLEAPLGNNDSKTFFSSNTGLTYSRNNVETTADPVSQNIDFGYYYGETENASLASVADYPSAIYGSTPAQWGWGTQNATQFWNTGLTGADAWADITNGNDILNLIENSTDDGGVITNLAEGQIVLFQVDGNKPTGNPDKYGVLYITTIVSGAGETGEMDIEVKIEQ